MPPALGDFDWRNAFLYIEPKIRRYALRECHGELAVITDAIRVGRLIHAADSADDFFCYAIGLTGRRVKRFWEC